MQIRKPTSVIVIVAALVYLVTSINVTTFSTNRILQNATATIGPSTNGWIITLGNPQLSYTENDKTTSFEPVVTNGTHGVRISFTGYGVMNGTSITDNAKSFITNRTGGAIYAAGHGELFSKNGTGGNSIAGTVAFTFQGIGHYGADGKVRETGTILTTKTNGNLGFAGNMVGIYKREIDKTGNAVSKVWFWK